MGGMKIGQKHNWNYKEHKYKAYGNNFEITQTKGRNTPAPYGSGMPTGSKLIWKIKGTETIGKPRKIKGYGWVTPITIKGTKRQGKYKLPKRRWK